MHLIAFEMPPRGGPSCCGAIVALEDVSFFAIQDFSDGGRHTFVLTGELDLAEVEKVASALQRVGTGTTAVTLDLSGLSFMGVAGLRIVLFTRELCQQRGHEFRLVPGSAHVQRIFQIAGLEDRLPFESVGSPSGEQ